MKYAIGGDHSALELKQIIIHHLESKGIEVTDYGTYTPESTHYPIYAQKVAKAVTSGEADFGIAICGTGLGVGISANKVRGIRAATVSDTFSARMARAHNNANVLTFGARVVGPGLAIDIVDAWLASDFEDGRHSIRVGMISKIENGEDVSP